jgi:Ni,Fe-hydrogenase III large subunit
MQTWRIREPVMWLCEQITGNRKTYGMNLIGGVRRDITPEMKPKILEVIDHLEKEWLKVIEAISGDTLLMMRLKGVGVLRHEDAVDFCVTGPTARGSGVAIDSRVDHPYAAYGDLVPEKKVHEEGDILARTLVRLEETLESARLVRQGIQELPEGPIMADIPEEIPAGREGVRVVEAPRGESMHYVLTGENNRPYRWKVRAPTYMNLESVAVMIQGLELADVPIAIASYDPCFSCTERLEVVDRHSGKIRIYTQDQLTQLSRDKPSCPARGVTPRSGRVSRPKQETSRGCRDIKIGRGSE